MPRRRVEWKRRRGRLVARWAAAALMAGVLLAPAPLRAQGVRLDTGLRPRIVNGLATHGYPTTGALLAGGGGVINAENASTRCSGTLVGCETFVVAAHCVDDRSASQLWVYLQHAGLFGVTAVHVHPDAFLPGFPIADLAVLKLGAWVTGIAPSALNTTDPQPFIPAPGIIVGFGQTSGLGNDYGIKRAGAVQTASCPAGLPWGASDLEEVCWNFVGPLGPPGGNSNTCNGDSGGPLFLDLGAGTVLAGVTSGGTSFDCLPTDYSYDANVFTYLPFLLAQLGGDATTPCGGLAPVGDAQTLEVARAGFLDALDAADSYTFTVPAGANALRVTLNGEDNGFFDPDLYVKQGVGAGAGDFGCAGEGRMVYGACTFDHPAPGTWSMAVERAQGAGNYQLTATVFGGPPPQCGNGVREFDETCDGAADALCAGLCLPDCTCPAPICGNDVREPGETCDGSAAPDCPGQCTSACQCPGACSDGRLYDARVRLNAKRLKYRARLLNFDGQFTAADPRNGLRVTFAQGAASVTLDIPAGDTGWFASRPDTGRYLWRGARDGFIRVRAIDRTAQSGTWRIIVVAEDVPGGGLFDLDQPLDVALTIDGQCTVDTF